MIARPDRGLVWIVAGNAGYTAFQWALMALLAKCCGSVVVGHFALGLAVSAPVFMLANLNLRTVLAADVRHEHTSRTYLRLRGASSTLALAVAVAAVLLLGQDAASTAIMLMVALMKYVESFGDVIYGLQQRAEDLRRVGVSLLLKSGGSLLVAAGLLLLGTAPAAVLAWLTAVSLAVLLLYDAPGARRFVEAVPDRIPGTERGDLAALARRAAPLGVVAALISLDANVPRYAVQLLAGPHELGVYAGVAFILMAGNNLVLSLCQATVARLARDHAGGRYGRYLRTIGWLIGGIFLACLAGGLVARAAGSPILALLYNDDFRGRETLFATLVLGGGLGYAALVLSYATTAARRFSVQMLVYGVSVAATVAACAWLGPGRGAEGVAYGRVLGWGVQFLLFVAVVAGDMRRRRSEVVP